MTMQSALRARLLADTELAGLVAGRIDWVESPQGADGRRITLLTVFEDVPQDYAGFTALKSAQVQIDFWSLDQVSLHAMRDAAIRVLAPPALVDDIQFMRGFFERVRDVPEPSATTRKYRASFDLTVHWR